MYRTLIVLTFIATAVWGQRFQTATVLDAFAKGDTSSVRTIASADFDGKLGPDLATVQTSGMLNVLYNRGSGEFGEAYHNNSAVAWNPSVTYIEASDVNSDGYPDIVALDSANAAFLVFINLTDGTFHRAVSVPAGGDGLTVADVNRDGRPDVVTIARSSREGSTTLRQQTFIGTGMGTFEPLDASTTTLQGTFFVAPGKCLSVVDMNADARPDLVLRLDQSRPRSATAIRVSLGVGDGTFPPFPASGVESPAGPQPASSLVVSDVNGDDIPDALWVAFSDRIYLAAGEADGSFKSPAAVLSNMSGAVTLNVDDFNRDGRADLAVYGSGDLGIFTGVGDGTFRLFSQYTGGYGLHQQPMPADFDGDGNTDLAWLDYTNGKIGIYAGKGDGAFTAASPVHPAAPAWAGNIQVISAADFNGDGAKDVLAYQWPHAAAGGHAEIYTGVNDGKGGFTFRLALPTDKHRELAERYEAFSVDNIATDFNRDGRADIILRTQSGLSVLLANPDGTLNPEPLDVVFPVPVGCMPFGYLTPGDVNGDGFTDIVAGYLRNAQCGPSGSTPSGLFVLLGNGTGRFNARFTEYGGGPFFVRLADLNADNNLDLVMADLVEGKGFQLLAAAGKGDGTFDLAGARTVLSGHYVSDILAVDFNGDGKRDLVVPTAGMAGADGSPVPGDAGVLLLAGNGDLTFGPPAKALTDVHMIWNGTSHGDFNGDRRPDLVFSTYTKDQPYGGEFGVIVLPSLGGGNFGPPVSLLAPLGVPERNAVVFTGDFNRDGKEDVMAGSGLASPLFLGR